MQRRRFLQGLTASLASVGAVGSLSTGAAAADSQLEPGTWYAATVTDVTDGDTVDVTLDSDGTEYEIRVLGVDTPETRRNGRYEEVREWEGIEDDKYLSRAGEDAKDFAQTLFPDGTSVDIAVDEAEDEVDPFGRLLAYIRYDATGDGTKDTLYNRELIETDNARVYGSSLTKHDDFWDAEATARANGTGLWSASDPAATPEVGDDPVDSVFVPNVASVVTDTGTLPASRAPVFAPTGATQDLGTDGLAYSGDVSLVGVDAASRVAMVGGLSIHEEYDGSDGQHLVFLTNLLDALSAKTGDVFIDGGHRQFNATDALSSEDAVEYQRYLEGQDVGFEQTNTYDGTDLPNARTLVVTTPSEPFTSSEVTAVSDFLANGGSVLLFGSAAASDAARQNLNDLAAGLGTDLRLNDDQVFDASGNAEYTTSNLNTADFSLFGAFS
jgi:endonuclease YncB( thermonuclease family)